MPAAAIKTQVTYAEYLAFERAAETRHEYINGGIYAMAGGTIEHGLLATNATVALANALRGRPCVVLNSDVRVRVRAPSTDLATYPDVTVVCGAIARADADPDALTNPVVIVEVLSDSTEAYDRGRKFASYRRIASLREYVLVSQSEQRIEVYQRVEHGPWTLNEYAPSQRIALGSIGVEIAVDDVYRNAAIPAGAL
jgi:Uma2 family endonuclease